MLTLTEASKLIQNPLQRGVVQTFAMTSPVLERLPFMDVAGNAYNFNREQTLPGVAFRDYNETYTESTGVVQPVTEVLKIFGGTSKVDRALVKTQGNVNDLRAISDAMKAKSVALDWTNAFFNGDATANPKAFDGLSKRLTGAQVIDGSGGLSLPLLDEMIDAVVGKPDVLFMSKAMRRKVNALCREAGQAIETVDDAFGRLIDSYGLIPIGIVETDAAGNQILESDIFAVRFGVNEYCSGLQAGALEVIDNGLVGVHFETLVEWICSFTLFNGKSAARLKDIPLA